MADVYDQIYWLTQSKAIDPEHLFAFAELYWPTFFVKNSYVFLKENFSEERYQQLQTDQEFWMNLLTVDAFFEDSDDFEKKSKDFSKLLVSIWGKKLKLDFPDKEFIIKTVSDSEADDYGLTFYQPELWV